MAEQTSVVTPQRFQEGFNYSDYMDQIKVNKARFEGFYSKFTVQPTEAEALNQLTANPNGPAKMMVIGEDWCGDVIRGLPVLARVAESCGIDMRIFPRDEHHDIMNEFLKNDQHMSIPVAVFYTKDHRYICHWIERPEIAVTEIEGIEAAIRSENPEIDDQDFGRERRARTTDRAEVWQQATVEELVSLISQNMS